MFKQTSCVSVQSSLCVCVLRAHGIESIICTHCWPLAYSVNLPQFCDGINIPWACHRRLKELSLQSSYAIKCDSINLHRISTYDENDCDNWYTDSRAISYAVAHTYIPATCAHTIDPLRRRYLCTHTKLELLCQGHMRCTEFDEMVYLFDWGFQRCTSLFIVTRLSLQLRIRPFFFPQHIRQ